MSVALLLLGSSSLPAFADSSLLVRISGIAILAIIYVWVRPSRLSAMGQFTLSSQAVILFLSGNLLFLGAATLPQGDTSTLILRIIALILFVFFSYLLVLRVTARELIGGALLGTLGIIIASYAEAVLDPAIGIEHLRLRGVLDNANVLGFVATVFVILVIATQKRLITFLAGLAIGLPALFLSGSRASLIMLVVALLGFAIIRVPRVRLLLFVTLVALVISFIQDQGRLGNFVIFRTTDSRSYGLEELNIVLESSPISGLGFQNGIFGVASAPIAAFIQAGIFGLLGLVFIYIAFIVASRKMGSVAMVFAIAAIGHSFFENWPLTLTGPMMFLFFIAWLALAKTSAQNAVTPTNSELTPPTTESGQPNAGASVVGSRR